MFVTHDIDEALKMGTLICILQVGGDLQQIDAPKTILSKPANSFVADFVGSDRGLKKLTLVRVSETMQTNPTVGSYQETTDDLVRRMRQHEMDSVFIIDDQQKLAGYVTLEEAQAHPGRAADILSPVIATTEEEATMRDAFSAMLSHGIRFLPVLDNHQRLTGMVSADDAQQLIRQAPVAALAR
jgi:osmoprotectant transport system ATP-binding protein